ncbi:uncharacterized protein KD926_011625 [Aspergillus affinis]|uniref:uncharacterized protein n=1 Tax=Aspergillus affinis TaxID=1070780 RepID=UPI0022FDB9A5|nr:uncharacterized protein KD926_011625 [Aspergillus affinis]KAI9044655.1 hypothetical protein KD926_011625 [Aspergillus affinis]
MQSSRFDTIPPVPPNEFRQLLIEFSADASPSKVSLESGMYYNENGQMITPSVVEKTKRFLALQPGQNHGYLPPHGNASFIHHTQRLIFGETLAHSLLLSGSGSRLGSLQTVSGTGANHLGAHFLSQHLRPRRVWIPDETWENHPVIWQLAKDCMAKGAQNLEIRRYPYHDQETHSFNVERMMAILEQDAQPNDVLLLHACAHNPTGIDPTKDQWRAISRFCSQLGLFPFFDLAYQGFASGSFEEDAWAIRHFVESGLELCVAHTFSKMMSLYGERVGSFHLVASSADAAARGLDQLVSLQMAEIFSPPSFGAKIAARIMSDPELYEEWAQDISSRHARLMAMRTALLGELKRLGTPGDWGYIEEQSNMGDFIEIPDRCMPPKTPQALPSGKGNIYPLGDPHAVSVSLPTWDSVIGLSRKEEWVMDQLEWSYPRTTCCMVFGSDTAARKCAGILGSKGLCYEHRAPLHVVRFFMPPESNSGKATFHWANFSVVLLPSDRWKDAMTFWRDTGSGLSTRHAEYCRGEMEYLDSGSSTPGFRTAAPRKRKLQELLEFSNSAQSGLRATLAQLATSDRPSEPTVQKDDVFLYPNGMNAIYSLSEALASISGGKTVAAFGTLADQHNSIIACDGTVAGFVNLDALPFVDVMVSSLTKTFSGSSNVTGGSLVLNPKSRYHHAIKAALSANYENICFPLDIDTLKDNCQNIAWRVRQCNENTLPLVDLLSSHPSIATVHHPSTAPTSSLYESVMRENGGGYGNVLSIIFHQPRSAEYFYNTLDVCKGSSFGTNFTLIVPYVQLANYWNRDKVPRYGVPQHILRLSVGLEDKDQLLETVAKALRGVEQFESTTIA